MVKPSQLNFSRANGPPGRRRDRHMPSSYYIYPEVQNDSDPFCPASREWTPALQAGVREQPCWVLNRRGDISTVLMDSVCAGRLAIADYATA